VYVIIVVDVITPDEAETTSMLASVTLVDTVGV
jgi:hypothetical protein